MTQEGQNHINQSLAAYHVVEIEEQLKRTDNKFATPQRGKCKL